MKANMYSVYDKVAEKYMGIFESTNDATAARAFEVACKDKKTQVGEKPKDYQLFKIGTFDDNNGEFESHIEKVQDGR